MNLPTNIFQRIPQIWDSKYAFHSQSCMKKPYVLKGNISSPDYLFKKLCGNYQPLHTNFKIFRPSFHHRI
jgi:hypothetical protein